MSRASRDYKSRLRCWNRENLAHGDRDAIVPRKAGSLSKYRAHKSGSDCSAGRISSPRSSRLPTDFPSEGCRKGTKTPIISLLPRNFPEEAFFEAHMHLSSPYWYTKTPLPAELRETIRGKVLGTQVTTITLSGVSRELLMVDAETFAEVFSLIRPYIFHGEYTAPAAENDYENAENYLTSDELAGFSISYDWWLMSLFSNTEEKGFLRAIEGIIREKARKLVCIVSEDTKLVDIYKALGFHEVATTIDDIPLIRKYHGDRFVRDYLQRHTSLRHVFMIQGESSGDDIRVFADYWKAKDYVQGLPS